jgi:hypothetical protein
MTLTGLVTMLLAVHGEPAHPRGTALLSRPKLSFRRSVLCTLAVQNACQMLSMRYSRLPGQPRYLTSTAVVVAEVVKMTASFAVLLHQYGPGAFGQVWRSVFVAWQDTLLVGVPALLYLVQNNLLYIAASNLDAATCQATAPAAPKQPPALRIAARVWGGRSKRMRACTTGGLPVEAAHHCLLLRHPTAPADATPPLGLPRRTLPRRAPRAGANQWNQWNQW